MKAKCEICGRVFEGETKEEIIEVWSRHNEQAHKSILESRVCCCHLSFSENQSV